MNFKCIGFSHACLSKGADALGSRSNRVQRISLSRFDPVLAVMGTYTPALQVEKLVDLEDYVGTSSDEEGRPWPWRRIIFGAFAVTAVMAFCSRSWNMQSSDLVATQQKSGIYPDAWETVTESSTPAPHQSSNGLLPDKIGSVNDLTGGKDVKIYSTDPLARPENLLDGNVCAHDEELLGTLCYKKCSLLTNGEAPVRLSAFSCAKSKGFEDFFRGKVGLLVPCEGYDVSGDEAGHGCPHKPGTCLVNEEFSLGKCYRRCDELTDGQYPYRTSANSCCKTKNFLECIEPTESRFSFEFNVGGGEGSFAKSHSPNAKFTELGH